jgi:mannose-6-phosphate isomerase-like protein (cupin superfamily)
MTAEHVSHDEPDTAPAGDALKLTPSESVRVVRSGPEGLDVEATYGPGGEAPPKHMHPAQDERFGVLEGSLRVRVDGEERDLAPGETIEIPRGSVHQMWNPGEAPARVSWRTAPAGRTEQWFRAIDRLHRQGRVGRNGMPGPLAFAALLTEFDDTFRLVAGPDRLVRGALRALAPLGRARGYLPAGR